MLINKRLIVSNETLIVITDYLISFIYPLTKRVIILILRFCIRVVIIYFIGIFFSRFINRSRFIRCCYRCFCSFLCYYFFFNNCCILTCLSFFGHWLSKWCCWCSGSFCCYFLTFSSCYFLTFSSCYFLTFSSFCIITCFAFL